MAASAGGKRAAAVAVAVFTLAFASLASAEVTQQGNLRVSFTGGIAPNALPRKGMAPVKVSFGGDIRTIDGAQPPQLRTISLAINRAGKLDYRGLSTCNYHQIHPASTAEAIATCTDSVIGTGTFSAHVALPEQSPFPSSGDVTAFNGLLHGRHVVFVHVYGTTPLPQSQVIVFKIGRTSGIFRSTLSGELPQVAADWGYVSGLSLSLRKVFRYKGKVRSLLSAGCPSPAGFSVIPFTFAKAEFGFEDGRTLGVTMTRSCRAKDR